MKAKFKFDTAIIKNFFADHWEKLVVGVCAIVMLFLMSTIFKRETLPSNLQASQIAIKTTNVQETVKSERPDKAVADLKPIDVPGAVAEVPVNELAEIPPFVRSSGPLLDPVKRTDPTYFPVLAVQVKSFVLAMATNAGAGGAGQALAPVAPTRQLDMSKPAARDTSKPGAAGAQVPPGRGRGRVPRPGTETTPAPGLPGSRAGNAADAGNPDNATPIPAAMPVPGAPGNGSAEVRPFNIVTAAVPVEAQMKEYVRRYSHARHAELEADPRNRMAQQQTADVPQYLWWRLERIDLTNGDEKRLIDYGDIPRITEDLRPDNVGHDLVVKTLKPTAMYKKLMADWAQWGGGGAEVVPQEYIADPWLTWPLPPMLLHDWGREATNPKIPLVAPQASETPDGTTPAEPGKAKDSDIPFDDKTLGSDTMPSPRPAASAPSQFGMGRGRGRTFDPSAPMGAVAVSIRRLRATGRTLSAMDRSNSNKIQTPPKFPTSCSASPISTLSRGTRINIASSLC